MPPSPLTPSGRRRPRCKICNNYMLGHDKATCAPSSVHSTTSTPPSTPLTEESHVGIFIFIQYHRNLTWDWQIISGVLTIHSGTDAILFLRNLSASPKTHVFVFEEINSSLNFQREAQKLGFHSALQVYCSPHTSKSTSIFAVVGETQEHVSGALQECLSPKSQITSTLWPSAAWILVGHWIPSTVSTRNWKMGVCRVLELSIWGVGLVGLNNISGLKSILSGPVRTFKRIFHRRVFQQITPNFNCFGLLLQIYGLSHPFSRPTARFWLIFDWLCHFLSLYHFPTIFCLWGVL